VLELRPAHGRSADRREHPLALRLSERTRERRTLAQVPATLVIAADRTRNPR
jgi:hypothetical protein